MILYDKNATDFFNLGLGPITTAIKATVTEERNGSFYLEATVLIDDIVYPKIQEDNIIKADASKTLKDQRFRIKRVVDKHDGTAEIYAEHVSYLTAELPMKPEVVLSNVSGTEAMNLWKASIIGENPLVVDSDIMTRNSTSWRIDKVKSPRQALGGVDGSMLDVWGGEYLFDNYSIHLLKKRGKTANTVLAYGRNITDFEQERNIESTYTSIFPYAIYTDDNQVEHTVTAAGYIVDSEYVGNYPNPRVSPVDFSDKFDHDEIPTKEKLKALAESYIKSNGIGIPKVSIKVSFLDLSQSPDYAEFKLLEEVSLCDDVKVIYPKLGIDTVAKVIRTVWNVLSDSYDEIEIGEKRVTLASQINAQAKQIKEANTQANHAQASADGKNTIFTGLYGENGLGEPKANKVGDTWFKPDGEFTIIKRWDGTIWKDILNTGDIAKNAKLIAEVSKGLDNYKKEIANDIDDFNDQVADAGFTTIGEALKKTQENIDIQAGDIAIISQNVSDSGQKIAILEQNYKGLQSTVNDKANQSQVTQLANGLQTTVDDLKNLDKNTSTRFTQLSNQIDLAVENGDVIGRINVQAGRTLIQNKKLYLDAETVVFSGKAFMPWASIKDVSIDGATIQDATIGSGKIVNLDVDKLSGNKANLIEASFVAANKYTHIDSDGINIQGSGAWRRTYLSPTGFTLYNGQGNKAGVIGYLRPSSVGTREDEAYVEVNPDNRSYVGIGASKTHNIILGYGGTTDSRGFRPAIGVDGNGGLIRVYRPLVSENSSIQLQLRTDTNYRDNSTSVGWFKLNDDGSQPWNRLVFGQTKTFIEAENSVWIYANQGSRMMEFREEMTAYKPLNMNGYAIKNQSDFRLKKNIEDTQLDSLAAIKRWNFVNYEWRDPESPQGLQFGLIAQETPEIAIQDQESDVWSINTSKQLMMTTHALQQLSKQVEELKEKIA